jgi:hypothetical protein
MSDTTSPNQTAALNSFSWESALSDIWDSTRNVFKSTIESVETAFVSGAIAAKATAQNSADAAKSQSYLPTVPVQASIDTNTMLFLGVALVAVLFAARKK